MIEVTHEEWQREIQRIANNEPGWSEPEILFWYEGWDDDTP